MLNDLYKLPYSTVTVLVTIIAIVMIVWVMAKPSLRKRFVGDSSIANAAVPLIAAGLVWVANWSGALFVNVVSDSTAPESNLGILIEDIEIGHPEIPQDYKWRAVSEDEIARMLHKFKSGKNIIRIKADEADRLNKISLDSFQAAKRQVSTDRAYTLKMVANFISHSMYYYYRYKKWGEKTETWSKFFVDQANTPAQKLVRTFVNGEIISVPDAGGIFQGMTGMIALDQIKIDDYDMRKCKSNRAVYNISIKRYDNKNNIDWGTFRSIIPDERDRVEAATKLVELIAKACAKKLANVFKVVSSIFKKEAIYMQNYLGEWGMILRNRKPDRIEALVTISNVGKFDTYVRREVRAAIGGKGAESKIRFTLIGDSPRILSIGNLSKYLPVKSRSASTFRFRAMLKKEEKESVFAAFNSGLNYIRIGVLASSGNSNKAVLSPVVAFSKKAKKRAQSQIEKMQVDF